VEESKRKGKLVAQVFQALDRVEDGKVSLDELHDWIKFEGVFQTGHHFDKKKISEKADATLKSMDENKDGVVSLKELEKYFDKWTVDQMRRVTTDLVAHSRKRQTQHKLIMDRLDSDKSGYVSPEEIREWSRDEKFASNNRLVRMLEQLKSDTQFDETKAASPVNSITRAQLNWFLNSLSQSDFEYLAKCTLTDECVRIDAIIKEVFDAMDSNKDGNVDGSELREWIKNEALFQITHDFDKKRVAAKQQDILKRLDKNSDSKVSFDELAKFFSSWTLREVRSVTESLLQRSRAAKADAGKADAGKAAGVVLEVKEQKAEAKES